MSRDFVRSQSVAETCFTSATAWSGAMAEPEWGVARIPHEMTPLTNNRTVGVVRHY